MAEVFSGAGDHHVYRGDLAAGAELICRFQADGTLTYANPDFCRYFALPEGSCTQVNFFMLASGHERQKIKAVIQSLNHSRPAEDFCSVTAINNETRWLHWSSRVLFDDQGCPVEYQAVGRDITEVKILEDRLAAAKFDLERRLERRSMELAVANENLQRLVAMHEENERKLKATLTKTSRSLLGVIKAISKMIEIRDPHTAGHQRRMTNLACTIAREMSLSVDQYNAIYVAGLLHDIGKISVPSEILSRPGRLTEVEYLLVKAHPQVGYDMLKEVDFPWPVAEMVLQHHERINGKGYPQELKGNEILLEAKILAVADCIEAMGSQRPYRSAFTLSEVLKQLVANKGVAYDPDVVDACLTIFRDRDFDFNRDVELDYSL
jgi:putative nucleotidyltransferase with HDIG domain/PAS domain S-box-containing protein